MTPEDIAKQRHHHNIVELLTDYLGCNCPKAVPAPTSPPEGQKSPLARMASPPATSPPAVEIHGGGGPAMMPHFQAARPKTNTVNRGKGTPRPRPATGNNNNNNAKRKQKKARPDEVISTVTTLSPPASLSPTANNVVTSCATGQAFSPNCMPVTNGLSPRGSACISPADSATLSPLQASNSLDAQPPSPLEILSPDDLAGLEGIHLDCWDELDLDVDAFSPPKDMCMCGLPPTTSIGQVSSNDHIVSTTSDCMYIPNASPSRRMDPLDGQRLYSVHSTPDLHCEGLQYPDSPPIIFNGRTCSSAQKASAATPSHLASYQAIAISNMYAGGGNVVPPRKYCYNDYTMQQPLQLQNQLVPGQMSARTLVNGYECNSPHSPTPSPDHLVLP